MATELRTEILECCRQGAEPLADDAFNDLALRVFAHNVQAVPAYRAYCDARDRTPDTVEHWTRIPAVPTAAFKEVPLHDASAGVERVFQTSGTTRGPERRGQHPVADLTLYRASLRTTFEAFLLTDGARPRILSLMPPAATIPDSSLAFMITDVLDTFGGPGSRGLADPDGLDFDALDRAAAEAVSDGTPVMLLGTSSAFIHWLDRLADAGRTFELPAGSRLMDTGGHKGRGRQLEPDALRDLYGRHFGLPAWACVNEYGMTELLSQYYDDSLLRRVVYGLDAGSEAPRRKRGPGWFRSVAVDPETLDPLPDGETGLLRHVDLANLFSVAAVQTEDVGRVEDGALILDGRAAGAPPRGCSIAMDILLQGMP